MRLESKFKIDNPNNNIIEYRETLENLSEIHLMTPYLVTLTDHVLNQVAEQDLS